MEEQNFCPCCGRHCDVSNPKCERGAEYQRTGTVAAEPHHGKERQTKSDRLKHYQEADIPKKLIINLRDINHVMRSLYEGKGSQKRILIVLNEVGNITQRELTERLGIQPGSVSEVIAKLEKLNEDWKTRYQETGKEYKHGDGRHKGHGHHDRWER